MSVASVTLAKFVGQAGGTIQGTPLSNSHYRGVKVVIDITAITAGSLTVTIQGNDPVSGKQWTLLASAALNGTGTTVLTVYPGLTAAANLTVSDVLPASWCIKSVVATGPVTATISASLLV